MNITGREKAFIGGLGAGITTLAGQLQVGGKLDAKTVAWSVGAWVATHLFVYYTTNTAVAYNPGTQIGQIVASDEKPADPPAPTDPAPSV
jgi:hypothetical protein